MKLMFEYDKESRGLERQAAAGGEEEILALAKNYLRSGDPRMEGLIESLRNINQPDAKDLIIVWAEQNEIPTAEDFVINLSNTRSEIDYSEASDRAEAYKFWLVEEDEIGRGGIAYGVEIWESPAGGKVWLIWGNISDDDIGFNYGIVDPKDHAWATGKDGEGILDYYRDYLD